MRRLARAFHITGPCGAVALAIVAGSSRHAPAAQPLTLSAAVAEALEKNPEIRAMTADMAAARGDVTTARQWRNPELSVAPGVNRFESADGQHGTQFHAVLGLTQTFEFPGKRALRGAVADKTVELRELALAGFRTQLTIRVRRAFHALLVAQEVVPLQEQGVVQAKTFVDAARRRAQGGVASEFEATKAEAELVAAQNALRDAQTRVMVAETALNTLLGRRPDDPIEVTGTLTPDVSIPDAGILIPRVLERNPSLKVQAAEVERSGLNLQSVRRSRLPDFTVGPNIEYKPDEQNVDLAVTLPLPLWDRKSGEIATATAEQEMALAELDVLRNEIVSDVTRAYDTLVSARASLALYTPELLDRVDAARSAAVRGYAEGRASVLVYLEAQRTYFGTQAAYLDALTQLYDAEAELETAAGVLLSEIDAGREEEKH